MYTLCVKALEHLSWFCFQVLICGQTDTTIISLCIQGEVIWQEGSAGHSKGLSYKAPAHSALRTFRGSHSKSLSLLMTVVRAPMHVIVIDREARDACGVEIL